MGKYGYTILFSIIFLMLGMAIASFWIQSTKTCFKLPDNSDPKVFGKYYWNALHTTVGKIPCGACREDAVEMMVFLHDIVNIKTNSPIYNEANLQKWFNKICDLKSKYNAQ